MCSNLEERITDAASKARSLLGQLGPLVWALHSCQNAVIPTALCVDFEPRECVAIGTDECKEKREERRTSVVQALEDLKTGRGNTHPEFYTSRGYRGAINRSVIVYAVAVLEAFLNEAGKPVWKELRRCKKAQWRTDTLHRVQDLKVCMPSICLDDMDEYTNVGWLVLVRNAIIHGNGRAREDVGKEAKCYQIGPRWVLEAGILRWRDDCQTELKPSEWKGKEFPTPIDEFIIPRLRDAQSFVTEAECRLLQHAQQLGERARPDTEQ